MTNSITNCAPASSISVQVSMHTRPHGFLTGFTSPNRVEYAALNIGELAKILPGDITPAALVAAGRVGAKSLIKILGGGDVSGARKVKAHAFSAAAKAKIEQAGGACEVIS